MAKQIKTAVEAEEYEFLDASGKPLFTISFHASDIAIIHRYDEVITYLNKLDMSTLQSAENTSEELVRIENELAEQLDKMFNANISEQIYSVMSPFTPLSSGKLYIEEIIEKIGGLIEAETGARLKKVQSRMSKYTAKYQKK
nr:MAG TPA: tail assembly chaperone [Caudoviricetes sp.]